MVLRKLLAVALTLLLSAGVAACGTDDSDTGTGQEGGPAQSTEEDPTLGDPEGGGTTDAGEDSTDDADGGEPGNETNGGAGTEDE